MDVQTSNFNYIPPFKLNESGSGCQTQQAEILACMKKVERGAGSNGKEKGTDCYLPTISAWNECMAKKVGYL